MKGWTVTWDGVGAEPDRQKIVAVFNYRMGVERVRDLVEQLYIALKYDEEDKVAFAANPRSKPYRSEVHHLRELPVVITRFYMPAT